VFNVLVILKDADNRRSSFRLLGELIAACGGGMALIRSVGPTLPPPQPPPTPRCKGH
jgi:hypothetical protein